jgi:hypothetical protein
MVKAFSFTFQPKNKTCVLWMQMFGLNLRKANFKLTKF